MWKILHIYRETRKRSLRSFSYRSCSEADPSRTRYTEKSTWKKYLSTLCATFSLTFISHELSTPDMIKWTNVQLMFPTMYVLKVCMYVNVMTGSLSASVCQVLICAAVHWCSIWCVPDVGRHREATGADPGAAHHTHPAAGGATTAESR